MLGYNNFDDLGIDLDALILESEEQNNNNVPVIEFVPLSLSDQAEQTKKDVEKNTTIETPEIKTRVQMEKLKTIDPAAKSVLYSDALRQLQQYDPSAYVAFITSTEKEVQLNSKRKNVLTGARDFTKSYKTLSLPSLLHTNLKNYKLPHDLIYYDDQNIYYNDDITFRYQADDPPTITSLYNDLKNATKEEFPISEFAVWRQFELNQVFEDHNIPFDNFLVTTETDHPILYLRTIQKDVYLKRLSDCKEFLSRSLRLSDLKIIRNDSFATYQIPFGNNQNRHNVRRGLKKLHIRTVSDDRHLYFNSNNMALVELYSYLQLSENVLINDLDFITTSYAISYYNTLPIETTMFSIKPWLNHLRIDGWDMCKNAKRIVNTITYKKPGCCTEYECFCFNPFKLHPLNLKRLFDGSFANYIRMASDVTDIKGNYDSGEKPNISLHFTMEQNILCGICRQNNTKCKCHIDPEKALRARGLFNTYIGRHYVILGKNNAFQRINATLTVTHVKDLTTFIPEKRKKINLIVADGQNVRMYDPAHQRLLHNNPGVVGLYSMPLCIYNHPEYNKISTDTKLYNFLTQNVNKLKDVTDKKIRTDKLFVVEDQLTEVVNYVIDYYREKRKHDTINKKRRLEDTQKIRKEFNDLCLKPTRSVTTVNLPNIMQVDTTINNGEPSSSRHTTEKLVVEIRQTPQNIFKKRKK